MRTFDGADVNVPNSLLVANEVTNWTMFDPSRRISVFFRVAYGTDLKKIPDMIISIALEHEMVDKNPMPTVLFAEMPDSSLNFELRIWTHHSGDWPKVKSDLTTSIYNALGDVGIEIPFPQRDLNVRSVDSDVLKTSILPADDKD